MGRYCHKCGQDDFADREQPIFGLITQFLNKVFALDGKTPITLSKLMIKPGFLSSEYRNGKIVRYVHPVKLFWFASLVFFALLISQMRPSKTEADRDEKVSEQQVSQAQDAVAAALTQAENQGVNLRISGTDHQVIQVQTDNYQEQVLDYFARYGPFVAFLFIPFFALLLALFFWRNKHYYMHHLVFALHFHTFLWIFFSLLIIVNIIFPNLKYPGLINFLFFLTPSIYLSIAMRRHYQRKRRNAIWKAILINSLYVVLILTVIVLLGLAVMKLFPDFNFRLNS
jgi:hypothetical protein